MTKQYEAMLYKDLLAIARARKLPLRGGKAALVQRLKASDAGVSARPEAPRKPDREVATAGGTTFKICGGCEQWDRRCTCEKSQDERSDGDEESDKPNKTVARKQSRKRA